MNSLQASCGNPVTAGQARTGLPGDSGPPRWDLPHPPSHRRGGWDKCVPCAREPTGSHFSKDTTSWMNLPSQPPSIILHSFPPSLCRMRAYTWFLLPGHHPPLALGALFIHAPLFHSRAPCQGAAASLSLSPGQEFRNVSEAQSLGLHVLSILSPKLSRKYLSISLLPVPTKRSRLRESEDLRRPNQSLSPGRWGLSPSSKVPTGCSDWVPTLLLCIRLRSSTSPGFSAFPWSGFS